MGREDHGKDRSETAIRTLGAVNCGEYILAARKLAQHDAGRRVCATISAIDDAVRWIEEPMRTIDEPMAVEERAGIELGNAADEFMCNPDVEFNV